MNLGAIADELYFNRVFISTNGEPKFESDERKADEVEISTFISDVFDDAFRLREISGWKFKPRRNVKRYFHFDIGDAVVDQCASEIAFEMAEDNDFDENKLLYLPTNAMMEYVERFCNIIVANTRPANISFIYVLAFASTLCGILKKNGKPYLMNCIASSVTNVFKLQFPYEWIYYDFRRWAFAYTFRHKQIHV